MPHYKTHYKTGAYHFNGQIWKWYEILGNRSETGSSVGFGWFLCWQTGFKCLLMLHVNRSLLNLRCKLFMGLVVWPSINNVCTLSAQGLTQPANLHATWTWFWPVNTADGQDCMTKTLSLTHPEREREYVGWCSVHRSLMETEVMRMNREKNRVRERQT